MFGDPPFHHEAWDEERWEAFLRDHDQRVDRYMELIFRFMRKYPQPDLDDANALAAWKASLRAWLRDKGWRGTDVMFPFLLLDEAQADDGQEEDAFVFFDGPTPFDDDDDFEDTLDELERLPVYQQAGALSAEVLDWAHGLTVDVKGNRLIHFCSHVAQIPAHVARGHSIGYERDTLGGNIACVKRALADANAALDLLGRMKRAPYLDEATYRHFYEQVYEVRNALGLYVLDLRDRFDLGVD